MTDKSSEKNDKKSGVEAVDRALSILETFSDGSRSLSLTELSQRTGYYMSTLLRLCASLERFGYIHRGEDNLFRLGPSLLRLGALYQSAFDLADYVRPALAELVEKTSETAAFYIRDGNQRICLYRLQSKRAMRHHVEEGAILPLDRGASARILVAYTGGKGPIYDKVRRDGYYVSLGERDPDVGSVAAPVFASRGAFVGSLSLAGMRSRYEGEALGTMTASLRQSAADLSAMLGHARRIA